MHYTGTIWRPPYEASSLLLEVTAGCTHHGCKFCTLYSDLPAPFKLSPMAHVEGDLQEAQAQLELWGQRHKVRRTFLTGGNPFVLHPQRLLDIAARVKHHFPQNETIGCFARVTDITQKSDEELSALQAAGYDGLTIGIETGDDQALAFMNKGYRASDILQQCRRLDLAGIGYHFFYLTGISGAGRGEEGARATAAVCNQLHPRRIGTSMLTLYPDSALYQEAQAGRWQEAGELEKYRELKALVDALDIPVWFGALGASNAIPMEGILPKDKATLSTLLDHISRGMGEAQLRQYRTQLDHL